MDDRFTWSIAELASSIGTMAAFFIVSHRSRAICSGTALFFYYVRAIHSAFFNKLKFHRTNTDDDTDTDFRDAPIV